MSVSLRQPVSMLALAVVMAMLLSTFVVGPLASSSVTSTTIGSVSFRLDKESAQQITGARSSTVTRVLTGILVVSVVVLVVAACATPIAPVAGAAALSVLGGWGGAATYLVGAGMASCSAWGPCQP